MTVAKLRDTRWRPQYSSDDDDLVGQFYVPALRCATSYDRATGYFSARILRHAAEGIEHLIRNGGRMRLVVGCTLEPAEVAAIERGTSLREAVAQRLEGALPMQPEPPVFDALELLAWMVANEKLEVRIAVPCDAQRRPVPATGIFHDKSGIVRDAASDRIAFNGSVNETMAGWTTNWETFDVFESWNEGRRVDIEAAKFERLWTGQAKRALLVDVPEAVRTDLLRFLPARDERPRRLEVLDETEPVPQSDEKMAEPPVEPSNPAPTPRANQTAADRERRRQIWAFIAGAARRDGDGMWVGPATAAVEPWPHQILAYERLWHAWPPRLLIADEVGLGKTVQAGLLLRQAWLSGRARRVLVMAPKAVLTQWQRELREKFNLHWPIYDGGKLIWPESPSTEGRVERPVARLEWLREPAVLVSSHLVRRGDRAADLLAAEPWDLVVLDEAHHARRRGAGGVGTAGDKGANAMLALMHALAQKTSGLVLLTATPMQVHPVEVWDLLQLLGLPSEWSQQEFLDFYDVVTEPPTSEGLERLSRLFRALERDFGAVPDGSVQRITGLSAMKSRWLLKALRDEATIQRRQLSPEERMAAYRFLRTQTPVRKLVSRHTRELLRRYWKAGKMSTRVADRSVKDQFVTMSDAERAVYDEVERYISTTYNQAAAAERNAVGFVMTIYRRRLASSFAALRATLERRLAAMDEPSLGPGVSDEDADDDELGASADAGAETGALAMQALKREEARDLDGLLEMVRVLPPDTKLTNLAHRLETLRESGYAQIMVFTQYGDTMTFLRDALAARGWRVMTYSGDGGSVRDGDATWRSISRDDAKRRFKAGEAELLLCTDAAAEGLNFQFCGALVNYDMPWNPMRVEQRIGRIDRLGQQHETIQILNLHYADTVETDVYDALRKRIGLFQGVVGKLQPILAQVTGRIRGAVLAGAEEKAGERARLTRDLAEEIEKAQQSRFDLDEDVAVDLEAAPPPRAPMTLEDLGRVLRDPILLPDGMKSIRLGKDDRAWIRPGEGQVRVTTAREYFEDHPDSVELWSPGSPVFPRTEPSAQAPIAANLSDLLGERGTP